MFRTEIQLPSSTSTLTLQDKIITTGSCFSDAIGQHLAQHKFNTLVNPFGVIYNPHSIHKALRYALHNQVVPEHTYVQHADVFTNYDFHSEFSSLKKSELDKKISDTLGVAHYFLKDASWIIITYGTVWVYERSDTGEIVANCHKTPASKFNKTLLSQKKVLESFEEFYTELKVFNPSIKIILTVSPVRHIKDTLPLNSVSKAVLRLACQTISETYLDTYYFPAYEIMMDDLRDYRFYKSDMLHPSEEAEEYIWAKFSETYFDVTTKEFVQQWKGILSSLQHKAFHPESTAHQLFLRNTLAQLEKLSKTVNVEAEINLVKSQLL
jgi:hypothetical protein